jgi:predicted kinase
MRPESCLFECYGLPGSGKTMLCSRLAPDLGHLTVADVRAAWRRDMSPSTKLAIVWAAGADLKVWIRVASAAVGQGIWRSPDGLRRLTTLPFLRARIRYFLRQRKSLLLDQALIQEVWSSLVSSRRTEPDVEALSKLLRALYDGIPVSLLHLDLPGPQAARRIANRSGGASRYERLPAETIAAMLVPGEEIMGRLRDAVRLAGLTTHDLDADLPEARLVEDARAVLGQAREKP